MAISTSTARGLTNRIASLRGEAAKLRRPTSGGRQPGEMELHAATLADAAVVGAEAALAEQITTDTARAYLSVYNDFLDATPGVRLFLGV